MTLRDDAADADVDEAVKRRAMDEAPVGITLSDPARPDNPLVYVNAAFERITGYPASEVLGRNCRFLQGPDTDPEAVATLARGIADERTVSTEILNYRRDGDTFWNRVKIAPLRDAAGDVTHFVGFQMDVTERVRAEAAVERERAALDQLVTRINDLLEEVTGALVAAGSREEIERRVCERVAATDPYRFAWLAERDLARDAVRPTAWHPAADAAADDLAVSLSDADHPVVRALESGDAAFGDPGTAPAGVGGERAAVVAVPLVSQATTHGVLAVVARRDALRERETVVLTSLARSVATAMQARASSRLIAADEVVEVELDVTDDDLFFVALSDRLDCTLTYEGAVTGGDEPSLFFATDADLEAAAAAARDLPGVAAAAVVGDAPGLLEVRLAAGSVVRELADRGARTRRITATDGRGHVAFDLPAGADARSVVEAFLASHPDSELARYHEATRPPTTEREFVAALEADLTDRQRTAIQRAYVSGYYDPDRSVTGEELAAAMGVTRSTFHQHRRAAERKLVAAFLDGDPIPD